MKRNILTTLQLLLFTLCISYPFGSFSQIIEDFETGATWPWAPWQVQTAGGTKVTNPVHNGTYSIQNPDWHYRTDVTYGSAGDDISMWVYFDAAGTGRTYWGFGASAAGCHSLVVGNNTSELILQENNGYGYADIAQVAYTFQGSKWYRAELVWNSGTNVTANLYDSDGTTLLTSVTATLPNLVPGGFALRSFNGAYMDDLGRNCGSGVAPTISANGSTSLCPGDQVQLTSDITNNIQWSTGATSASINVSTAGSYYVTAQDACGISGGLTSNTITVNVNPNPTVNANVSPASAVCPNESITLYGSGAATSYSWDNGVTDGVAFNIPSTTTYQVTGTDGNGCTNTDQITITAEDNVAPSPSVASLPDITEECEVASLTAPTASDNCDGTITGTHNASLPISTNSTITWTYTDAQGNSSTQTQNVIIDDVTAPVADVANLPDVTAQCEVNSLTAPTATDNCDGALAGTHNASFPITSTTTVTWTYTDIDGNSSTQTQQVVIDDVTAPVADVTNLPNLTDECEITSLTAPTATDNCDGSITGTHNATLPISATSIVTWTYTDVSGNTTTQTQDVIIDDVTAPVADVASLTNVTDQCEVTSLTAPTATDNCDGTVVGTHNATLPISATTTVTWTYTDNAGNTTSQTQDVIIDDVTAPVADVANLPDVTAQCEVNSLTAPTATDNCDGTITGTHNATLPITATATVTWTYTDNAGNTTSQTQDVIIDDVTAPVVDVANLPDVTDECEVASLSAPTATDNCDGALTGTHNATLPISATTTVTWTYTDLAGNTTSQTQEVIIDDVTAPVSDSSGLVDLQDICEITTLDAPTATDNCDGTITATHNATLPITDSTVITWTFTDATGNTSTQTQNVFITGVNTNITVNQITITAENDNAGVTYQWYDCNEGASISGETDSTFTATTNGDYAVIVTEGGCVDTSDCVAITTVGINEFSEKIDVSIYPNPTDGKITIDGFKGQTLEIYDAQGRMVIRRSITEDKTQMDLSQLKKGVYYFNSMNQTFKVILN